MVRTEIERVQIEISQLPVQEQAANDPYLCYWAEWYYMVVLSAILVGEPEAQNRVLSSLATIDVVLPNRLTESATILQKGFTLSDKDVTFKTGALTGLILDGSLQNWILLPSGTGQPTLGRKLKLAMTEQKPREMLSNPSMSSGMMYQKGLVLAQRGLFEQAMDGVVPAETAKSGRLERTYQLFHKARELLLAIGS